VDPFGHVWTLATLVHPAAQVPVIAAEQQRTIRTILHIELMAPAQTRLSSHRAAPAD
jgi:hypothetical protein